MEIKDRYGISIGIAFLLEWFTLERGWHYKVEKKITSVLISLTVGVAYKLDEG